MRAFRQIFGLLLLSGCAHQQSAPALDSGEAPQSTTPTSEISLPHKHGHNHQHGLRHDFSDAKKWSKKFDDPNRDEWQKPKEVISSMQITPGARVAEIGAGTGYFLPHLHRAVGPKGEVLALDIEPNLIAHLKQRIKNEKLSAARTRLIKPENPELSPAEIDRILTVNTWHHIADRVAYSQHLARALKPGGMIFIVDFSPDAPAGGPGPRKKHRIPSATVESELRSAGLSAHRASVPLPYQYVIVGTKQK